MTYNPTNIASVSDNLLLNLRIKQYGSHTNSAVYAGGETNLDESLLSGGITLSEFASNTLAAANANWQDTTDSTASLTFESDRRCATARRLRCAIKFKSESGVDYTITGDILKTAGGVTSSGGTVSWSVTGNGTEMTTGWTNLPDPGVDESYTVQIANIQIDPDTGSNDNSDSSGDCSRSGNCAGNGEDSPGDGPDELRSASFWISLGAGTNDESAGILAMRQEVPSTSFATPASLRFDINTNAVVLVTNADGSIDVLAPTLLARVAVENNYAYWIRCYAQTNGSYLTNSSPFITHLIANPNGLTNCNTLQHVRFRGSAGITNEFTCELNYATNQTWRLILGNSLRGERLSKSVNTNNHTRLESYSIFTPGRPEQQLYSRQRLYTNTPYGDRLLSQVIDPGGLALSTSNSYNTLGQRVLSLAADGSWIRHEYSSAGLLARLVRPLANQPPTASADDCRVTEYDYSSITGLDDPAVRLGQPRTLLEKIQGQIIGKTMHAYWTNSSPYQLVTVTQTSPDPAATWADATTEETISIEDNRHRLTRLDHADGTRTAIEYITNGTVRLTKTSTGVPNGDSFSAGTRVETSVDSRGRMMLQTTYDIASEQVTDQQIYAAPDTFGRPTTITYLDGTTAVNVRLDCCHSAYTVNRDGVRTDFFYDALNRLQASTRLGITTSNILDAANRLFVQIRIGSGTNGTPITLRQMSYDAAGRLYQQTNALNGVTTYSDTIDGNFQRVKTVINPDNGSRTEIYFRDGFLAQVTGNAAQPLRYEYGVEPDNGVQRAYTKAIRLDAAGNDTGEWTKTYADGAGRDFKTIYAAPTGQANPFTQTTFNPYGQRSAFRDADGNSTYFYYNTKGELYDTVLDMGGAEYRTNRTISSVATNSDGYVVRRNASYRHPCPSPDYISEVSLNGLRTWSTSFGLTTKSVRTLAVAGTRTVTATAPDQSYSVSTYQWGRLVSVMRYDKDHNPLGGTTYDFDEHGRQWKATDQRTGPTCFAFDNADHILAVTNPPVGSNPPTVTQTVYDLMGRATNVIHPDTNSTYTEYYPNGLTKKTYGSRTYPVQYEYDGQGRKTSMTTWQSYPDSETEARTTWQYDGYSGFLTNKMYADSSPGPGYTYTDSGRLTSRRWARNIIAYHTNNAVGEATGVSYTENAYTPAVAYARDARGRIYQVSIGGTNTANMLYDEAGRSLSEAYSAGPLSGLTVSNIFDNLGRRTTNGVLNGSTWLTQTRFEYGGASRLKTVAAGDVTADYSYLTNSPLVENLTFRQSGNMRMTTTKAHDNLNRLTRIGTTNAQQTAINYFGYKLTVANERRAVTNLDASRWVYYHDTLGQVTSGKKFPPLVPVAAGLQFEYSFDDIGNRKWAKFGGDASGANLRQSDYSVNVRNQYYQRTVPGYLNIIGTAASNASVAVNDQAVVRQGAYWWKELAVDNSTGAVWQAVDIGAVIRSTNSNPDLVQTSFGYKFLPQTPESSTHDVDGNLTQEGRWDYTWDGENRLVQMVARTGAGPQHRLEFAYDWQGRRVRKRVWENRDAVGEPTVDLRFVYDGWNLIAVLNSDLSPLLSFSWGLDLSGSLQGAGGVGGLLAMTVHTGSNAGTYLPAFDGNGNIMAYVNAGTGAVAAEFDYGPFGELLRATGPLARECVLLFSTKFLDWETGLYYYGYRFYDPSTGRWLSMDPLAEQGGMNLFCFVQNNPVDRLDVLGWISEGGVWPPPTNAVDPPSGPFSQCRIALRCGMVTTTPLHIPLAPHCGLIIDTGSGVFALDGSGGLLNSRWVTPATTNDVTGPWKDFPSSSCDCLFSSVAQWNDLKVPRNNECANSNWNLKCMLRKCNLQLDWGSQSKPLGYNCMDCIKWGVVQGTAMCYCQEWREKPCPDK